MPDSHGTGRSRRRLFVARNEAELVQAVRDADAARIPLRIGGLGITPLLEGFDGRVVQVALHGMTVNDDGCSADSLAFCGGVTVTVGAGEYWQDFVALTVAREWAGVERLGDYAGTVGGATVGNVRAYGQSVADTVAAVRTWDRVTGSHRRFAMVDCRFDEAGSLFSREEMPDGSPRYVVLDVAFLFRMGDLTDPVLDQDLARLLDLGLGQRAPLSQVHDAVLTATIRPTAAHGNDSPAPG